MPREDVSVVKYGLKIPVNAANYEDFVAKMMVCERKFMEVVVGR